MWSSLYSPLAPCLGFLNCGHMGQSIAHNLLRAGYALRIYDTDPGRSAELASQDRRAVQVHTPGEVAEPGSIVVSMVSDESVLQQMILGPAGILARLGKGGIHLSLSTLSPRCSEQLAHLYAQQGAFFLAANVCGRPDVAVAARLSIYLAGDPAAKARVQDLLHAIGQQIYDLGTRVPVANVATLAVQYLMLAALIAMGETAELVERAGGDRALFLQTVAQSPFFGGAVYRECGAAMIGHRDYQPALFDIRQALTETNLMDEAAADHQMALLLTEPGRRALQGVLDAGRGYEDWSALAERCVQPATRMPAASEPLIFVRRTLVPPPSSHADAVRQREPGHRPVPRRATRSLRHRE